MALHCSNCNSTDVVAGFDKMQCLTCGAILDPLGQPSETTEYIGTSEPARVVPATVDVYDLPSGEDGYIEGVASENAQGVAETTEPGNDTGGAEPEAAEEDLSSMTKAELADVAEERGVEIPSGATKAEMLDALSG